MEEYVITQEVRKAVETLCQLYWAQDPIVQCLFMGIVGKPDGKSATPENKTEDKTMEPSQLFLFQGKVRDGKFRCPRCGSEMVVKNGTRKGKQRYLCRHCGRTFTLTTNSILYKSHKDLQTWSRYLECVIDKYPLRRCASVCNISLGTAFFWRHKILDTLRLMQDEVHLNGIVEADETYTALSFKGNHANNFILPRPAKKRGEPANKPGLSAEQVCSACAVNLNGLSVGKVTSLGKPKYASLKKVLDGKIVEESILVTDSFSAYRKLSEEMMLNHIRIRKGHHTNGSFNIQTINNYHGQFKGMINGHFKGVATKYLNNYLVYHNFMNYSKGTLNEKWRILMAYSLTAPIKVTIADVRTREAVPLPQ